MLRSMFSAISGLRAHQTKMDVTGNNIANVNTVGYKSSQTVFQDTLSQVVRAGGAPAADRGGTSSTTRFFPTLSRRSRCRTRMSPPPSPPMRRRRRS